MCSKLLDFDERVPILVVVEGNLPRNGLDKERGGGVLDNEGGWGETQHVLVKGDWRGGYGGTPARFGYFSRHSW